MGVVVVIFSSKLIAFGDVLYGLLQTDTSAK